MDLGFYQCISRALNMYLSTQDQMKKSLQSNVETLAKFINAMDSRLDKQKFLEANNSSFIMPKKFEFQPPVLKGEEVGRKCQRFLHQVGLVSYNLVHSVATELERSLECASLESICFGRMNSSRSKCMYVCIMKGLVILTGWHH